MSGGTETRGIGARVKAVRAGRALMQAELAERVGTSQVHISRIETGHRVPRARMVRSLAEALGVPVETLTGAEDLLGEAGDARERPSFGEPLAADAVSEGRGGR